MMRAPQVRPPSLALLIAMTLTSITLLGPGRPRAAGATDADGPRVAPAERSVPYLIVTTDDLAREFERLADWKRRSGVGAEVHTLSEIRLLVPAAADDAERIRTFLRDAHAHWGTRWVLLGGDVELIPIRIATLSAIGPGQPAVPTDLYYACLDGSWNANGNALYGERDDDVDVTPKLFVGRAPVKTASEARRFVQKTLFYERAPGAVGSNTALLVAGRLTVVGDLAPFAEQLAPILTGAPGVDLARLYTNSGAWPGSLEADRASVLASLEAGPDFVHMTEAGGADAIATVDEVQSSQYITTADVLALGNAPRCFNFVTVGASVNHVNADVSIGEALIRAPGGGAVTVLAPTDIEFLSGADAITREYVRLLYTGAARTVGEAAAGMIAPFVGPGDFSHLLVMGFLLLGDPELHPRTSPAGPILAASARFAEPAASLPVRPGDWLTHLAPRSDGSPEAAPASSLTIAMLGPNPVSAGLRVRCSIPASLEGAGLDLSIFDLAGRRVHTIEHGRARAGALTAGWDLADEHGRRVAGGLYFMRLTVGPEIRTRRVVVSP